MDLWFSTVVIAAAIFLFAMINPDKEVLSVIAKIGKQYSMVIYITHIPLARVLDSCLKPNMGSAAYEWVRPFATIAAALLTAAAAAQIKNRFSVPMD